MIFKQRITIFIGFLLAFTFFFSSPVESVHAQSKVYLDVADKKVIGNRVEVPVTLRYSSLRPRDLLNVSQGKFTVNRPTNSRLLTFKEFKPSAAFDGSLFQTYSRENNGEVTVEFTSTANGNDQQIRTEVVGYLVYDLSRTANRGDSEIIDLSDVSLKDKRGNQIDVEAISGEVEHNLMIGDVVGMDDVTPAAAVRILQHVNQTNPIRSREEFNSADVNADGVVDLADATQIMRYVTGLDKSFLTLKTTDVSFIPVGSNYTETLEAVHGKGPYTWEIARGRLPRGLELNSETGEISGVVTRDMESEVIISVSDVTGKVVQRDFVISAVKTNIQSVEKLSPITVKVGETPNLPKSIGVTYTDGTKKTIEVTWDRVVTNVPGVKNVRGILKDTKIKVSVQVNVVEQDIPLEDGQQPGEDSREYISNIEVQKFTLLNTFMHTIVFDSSSKVYSATLSFGTGRNKTTLNMHYDPGDESFDVPRFSRGTTLLSPDDTVTITVFDEYGRELSNHPVKLSDY